jgi:arylsulfatase A-like enzyme
MKTLSLLAASFALLAPLAALQAAAVPKTSARPNIVFVLIDDMPWFGTPVRMDADMPASAMAFRNMPHVEKLAAQGMTFRNARAAAAMCAPARCSIQTGMMTAHHLFSGNGGFGAQTDGTVKYMSRKQDLRLPLLTPEPQGNIRFPSIGDVLKAAGYATAHFGKWHLYGGGPAKHGFDESDGETDNKDGAPAVDPATGKKQRTTEDPKHMFSITQRSMDFMARQVKAGKPFFVQLSHYATHAAYQARKAALEKNQKNPVFAKIADKRKREEAILCAAMAEDLDTSIGRLLAKLDELGIAQSTLVVFTADNGYHGWNEGYAPLRGGKWWLWEGGLRVPLIVRGPGIPAGSRSDVNVVGYDFLPTFADFAGATSHLSKDVEGVSFKPVLLNQPIPESLANRALYFHYPHYRVSPPCSAIVRGDMKLLHFYEWPNDFFLYNLASDLGERSNLAKAQPEVAAQMQQDMMTRLKAVGAYFPKPNSNADPNAKRYDPNNLADQGEGGGPEATASDAPPAGAKKNGKANKRL